MKRIRAMIRVVRLILPAVRSIPLLMGELKRIRRERDHWKTACIDLGNWGASEIERFRAERDEARAAVESLRDRLAVAEQVRAEVEQLRAGAEQLRAERDEARDRVKSLRYRLDMAERWNGGSSISAGERSES